MTVQAYTLSGTNALPSNIISTTRNPTTTDKISPNGNPYPIGQDWVNTSTMTFFKYSGGGTWIVVGGTAADVNTLSGDSGGNLSPTGGNIAIAGGTNITTVGSGSTITVDLDAAVTGLTSLAATTITTNVAAAQLSLAGTTISGNGTDANINVTLTPKGTGDVIATLGDIQATSGNVVMSAAGTGLQIKEGANARMGTATLVAGTVTINNTSVTANTRIILSRYSPGASTAVGTLSVGTVTPATSFVIDSLNPTDATVQTNDISVVHWLLIEPAT